MSICFLSALYDSIDSYHKRELILSFDIIKVISEERKLSKYSDPNRLNKEAVPFVGQVKQLKSAPDKIYLRLDSISSHGQMLEFKMKDIMYAEDVNTVTKEDGLAINIVRIWVKKESIGIKLDPFVVNDYNNFFSDRFPS